MNLEVGMYVRTYNGKIKKIVFASENNIELSGIIDCNFLNILNKNEYNKAIKKASFNLIDLIEVGDIIVVDDIKYTVLQDKETFNNSFHIERLPREGRTRKTTISHLHNENKIQSILTKEQFEANTYTVKE